MKSKNVFKNENFKRLWIGQAISQFGDAFYFLVFLYMVDSATKDPRMVGAVAAIQALPYLFGSLYAGVIADRIDRRSILLFSDLASFLILLFFGIYVWITPAPSVILMLICAFSLSVVNVFFAPAKSALLPTLVDKSELPEALSVSAAVQHFMPLAGLAISGALLGAIEKLFPGRFFFVAVITNAITFSVSYWFISRIPRTSKSELVNEPEGAIVVQNFKTDLIEGFDAIRSNSFLKVALALTLCMEFFISPFMLVYIAANRIWFGGEFWRLALVESAFVLAMLIASLAIGKMRIIRPGKSFVWGIGITGLLVLMMGVWTDYPRFLILNLLCGIAVPFGSLPLQTHIQLTVPNHLMGRVQSIFQIIGMTVVPIGAALGGFVMQIIGPAQMYILMGSGFMGSILIAIFSKQFFGAITPIENKNDLSDQL